MEGRCKEGGRLSGKLPLVSGMPVFCTENIATELRISKGCMGKLVSVKYVDRSGRRYAVSAEVDFPGYRGKDPLHPHRVLLSTVSRTIRFKLPDSDSVYSASRHQLPLIPAFAFTSHNSQGRSLEKACIDLASCVSIQSAYIMVSRLKSRKGLCILRPFNLSVIQKHVSEEIRSELGRTSELELRTLRAWRDRLKWYYNVHDAAVFNCLDAMVHAS
jgi:ATP-dependent exoDNAse (exonuclease V) alpha subunit